MLSHGERWRVFCSKEVWNYISIDIKKAVSIDTAFFLCRKSPCESATENVLFEVEYNGRLLLIPAVDEFVCEIDEDNRKLYLNIPDGLLDL